MTTIRRFRDLGIEEYHDASAVELAQRVAAGSISPVALTELALSIAETAESSVNAYVSFRREKALRTATALEREARDGTLRSNLHGVPIAVKDNMHLAGEQTLKGSRTSSTEPASDSAPVVDRLMRAGMIAIGKTTTPEFGWKGTGISPLTGVTRNPWNTSRTSGGSSAGSGVTVGTGAVPVALGSDAGGSIRIPASFCGVVGLKPTLGAIPVWPGTVNETLSHIGPLTRSVADARAVLHLTRGADPRDPQSAYPTPLRDQPGRRLRVGFVMSPFGIAPDASVGPTLDAAFTALRRAGIAEVEDVELSMEVPRTIFETLWVSGRGLGFAELIRRHGDIMDPGLARLLPLAERYTLKDYYQALDARRAFSARVFAMYEQLDLLVTPTMPGSPFAAEAEMPDGGEADAPLPWITWTPYTYPFNITGQPAIAIPCGYDAEAMPVGLQIIGPWGHDQRVLDYAQLCETTLAAVVPMRVAPVRRSN